MFTYALVFKTNGAVPGISSEEKPRQLKLVNDLRSRGMDSAEAALQSAKTRLRAVVMTALVAGIGFIPMAISGGQGAEL